MPSHGRWFPLRPERGTLRPMAKLIKRGTVELDDTTAADGMPEGGSSSGGKVISGKTFQARAEAETIRVRAEEQAKSILAAAEERAEALVIDAQEEAERLRQEAHGKGYEEGKAQGAAELAEVVARASQRMQAIEDQVVPQLKALALGIARKILGSELDAHPERVVEIVKQALNEKARQRREIFLRVNPEDMEIIRNERASLVEVLSRCKEIGLREDPDVALHGVIIETDAGIIDAQLETQLAVFERVLKDAG